MQIIDVIRASVRPYITVTGWTGILVLAIVLALRFASQDMATTILAILTGSMTTILGFWFGGRQKPPNV